MFEVAQEKSVSECRTAALKEAVEILKNNQFLDDLEAIILFGSTARGDATKKSDIDIFCVTKDGQALKNAERIVAAISEKIPGAVIQIGGGSRDSAFRFVSRKNKNYSEPKWEILFSHDENAGREIDSLIKDATLQR